MFNKKKKHRKENYIDSYFNFELSLAMGTSVDPVVPTPKSEWGQEMPNRRDFILLRK